MRIGSDESVTQADEYISEYDGISCADYSTTALEQDPKNYILKNVSV
jgi:hypothetical protein